MALFLPQRWRRQPQSPVGIAWENPITEGLVALFDQRARRDLARNNLSTSTSTLGAGFHGIGSNYSGATNDIYAHRTQYAITGALSIVALADIRALTNYSAIISKSVTGSTYVPYEFRLGSSATGSEMLLSRASAAVQGGSNSGANRITTPYYGTLGVSVVADANFGVPTFFVGRSTFAGGAWTNNATSADDGSAGVYVGARQAGTSRLDGIIYYVALFNRPISANVVAELHCNPWQLFAPISKRIFFDVGTGGTAYTLTAAQGTFTLTGNAASLLKGSVLLATVGSFVETGNAAGVTKTSTLTTSTGSFTETGNDAALTKQWFLTAATGAFVETGVDVILDYSGDTHPPLVAGTGSFTLTGNAANLLSNKVLVTSVGTFIETGIDVSLRRGNSLVTEVGAFTETGNAANLVKTYVLTTEVGVFLMTGRNVNLIWSGSPGVSVTMWTGVSKLNNSEVGSGVSEKSHDVSGGPVTYTVTETSAVSSDKKDSVNYVGYEHS